MAIAQLPVDELLAVVRRRRRLLILPIVILTALSVIGSYKLPRKYVSTTTILVQRDEILNPLMSFSMAVVLASEDRLRTFNEIIYSRKGVQMLIDSLGLTKGAETEAQRQERIKEVQKNIETDRRGDSFSITYTDSDPARAQRAASLVANLFIQTSLQVENERNHQTVEFFEKKLEEFRQKFEASQKALVSTLQQRFTKMPTETRSLYAELDDINRKIADIDKRIQTYRDALVVLRTFPDAIRTDTGKRTLFDLRRTELPFASDLQPLLTKYDDYIRRYTARYPEVEKLEAQILDILERMRRAVESGIPREDKLRWDLESQRFRIVDDLKRASVIQKVDQDKESNYNIYQQLYDDMKLKIEQARTTRDLGSRGAERYVILDPAQIPTEPSKPNRSLVIFGGFGLGLLISVLSVIAAELLDTTVRAVVDIESYQKPVIAFIPDAEYEEIED